MSDKEREKKALRTISVSSRVALTKAEDAADRKHIVRRTDELLVELEGHVRQDGNDPDILEAIEQRRQEAADSE
jgi:hypothetical protein